MHNMINPAELAKSRFLTSTDLQLETHHDLLQRATDDEIKQAIHREIEGVLDRTKDFNFYYPFQSSHLFTLSGDNEYVAVARICAPKDFTGVGWKIANGKRLQDLAFEAMTRYGFDPNIYRPSRDLHEMRNEQGVNRLTKSVSEEKLIYPASPSERLAFVRKRQFYADTGETISVSWSVHAAAPKKPRMR